MHRRLLRFCWIAIGFLFLHLFVFVNEMLIDTTPERVRYQPISIDEKNVFTGFAYAGVVPTSFVRIVCVSNADEFKFFTDEFPYFKDPCVIDSSYRVVVKQDLPLAEYVVEITSGPNSIVVPLEKRGPGLYSSSPFIPLNQTEQIDHFLGIDAIACPHLASIDYHFKKRVVEASAK